MPRQRTERHQRESNDNLLDMCIANINKQTTKFVLDKDIESAATEWVKIIINKSAEENDMFEWEDIIRVGSSTEGTVSSSIIEMDFMVVLKYTLLQKRLKIKQGCRDGFRQIFIEHPGKILRNCCSKDLLQCLGIKLMYVTMLNEVRKHFDSITIRRKSGMMKLSSLDSDGANFVWTPNRCKNDKAKPILVYVDIMHSFRVDQKKMSKICCLDVRKNLQRLVLSDNCYLVRKPCEAEGNCWMQSFAIQERNLMLSMSDVHKKCYICLKWLFVWQNCLEPYLFTSYVFKTSLLQHTLNNCDDHLSSCFLSVLKYIEFCLNSVYMPSFFIPGINVLQNWVTSKLRKIVGSKKIFNKEVEATAKSFLGQARLELYYDSVEACFIVEFWRRILCLMIKLFENASEMSAFHCNFHLVQKPFDAIKEFITSIDEEEFELIGDMDDDIWFTESRPEWEDVQQLRHCYKTQILQTEFPFLKVLKNDLRKFPIMKEFKRKRQLKRRFLSQSSWKTPGMKRADNLGKRHLDEEDYLLLSNCELHTLSKHEMVKAVKVRKIEYEKYLGPDDNYINLSAIEH